MKHRDVESDEERRARIVEQQDQRTREVAATPPMPGVCSFCQEPVVLTWRPMRWCNPDGSAHPCF